MCRSLIRRARLHINSEKDLASHNKLGASREGFALETAVRSIGKRNEEPAFWATHSGTEADLFRQENGKNRVIEIKYRDAPRITPSISNAVKDLELSHMWNLYPGDRAYSLGTDISTLPLRRVTSSWKYE